MLRSLNSLAIRLRLQEIQLATQLLAPLYAKALKRHRNRFLGNRLVDTVSTNL
jgi:hypothetical protein